MLLISFSFRGLISWRIIEDENYESLLKAIDISYLEVLFMKLFIRRKKKGILIAQGLGRHTIPELQWLMKRDLEALSNYLGERIRLINQLWKVLDLLRFRMKLLFVLLSYVQSTHKKILKPSPELFVVLRSIHTVQHRSMKQMTMLSRS